MEQIGYKQAEPNSGITSGLLNTVFHGDVMDLLKKIPDNTVHCVIANPDYNVEIKYNGKSYTTSFEQYILKYISLATELIRIMRPDGNAFFINYPRQNSYLQAFYLDDACHEVLDYAWVYNVNIGHSKNHLTTAHRSILHARKSAQSPFYKDAIAVPYQNPTDRRIQERISQGSPGRMPYSWLYYNLVKNFSRQKTIHPCQIPQALTELLVKSCTRKGDTVFIPFGGSGAELDVCRRLERNFISAEIDPAYIQLIHQRLDA